MTTVALIAIGIIAILALFLVFSGPNNQELHELRTSVKSLRNQLEIQRDAVRAGEERITNQSGHLTQALKRLDLHDGAAGGFWKTATGHRMRVKDMSTNHLENTLKMFHLRKHQEPFVAMQRELNHRKEDAEWKSKTDKLKVWQEAKDRANDVKAQYGEFGGWKPGVDNMSGPQARQVINDMFNLAFVKSSYHMSLGDALKQLQAKL